MLNSRSAAVLSVALCLPFLFVIITAMLNYEPPFVQEYLTEPDGYTPTSLARLFMLVMLVSVPVAFAINLRSMFTRAGSEKTKPFKLTPAHTLIGLSILLIVFAAFSQPVLHELSPFVRPLGPAAILGQALCLLGLLPLPVAFLLNRLPRFAKTDSDGAVIFQPTSINLIIGAAILLIILLFVSAIALETMACAIGVPNCD